VHNSDATIREQRVLHEEAPAIGEPAAPDSGESPPSRGARLVRAPLLLRRLCCSRSQQWRAESPSRSGRVLGHQPSLPLDGLSVTDGLPVVAHQCPGAGDRQAAGAIGDAAGAGAVVVLPAVVYVLAVGCCSHC
jgi:hypothetical protein